MDIRELGIADINEIKQLFFDIFTTEPWNDDWSDKNQLHEYITDLIGNRNSISCGMYEGDELIGISLGSIMHWCTGAEYYIFEFCIKPEHQGKGIGTAFLEGIEKHVKSKRITHIFLQTERIVPAFDFYKKNGFTELQDHVSLCKFFDGGAQENK